MAVDEQRIAEFRNEARKLTGQLGQSFRASDPDGDIDRAHKRAREFSREVQAKEERAVAGLSEDGPALAGGVRSRYGELGNGGIGSEGSGKGKSAADRAYRDMLLMSLLDQLQADIDATMQRIEVLEDRLIAEFGDDFLEDNARMYLGEDMPERPPGISDAEWNKLLQDKLADKMLNPDGSIKAEYLHLDIAKWLAEQRRLAALQAQAEKVVEGAELLAQGGLSQAEMAELKSNLSSETLAVLRRSTLELENDSLRKPFQESVVSASSADEQGASERSEAELAAAKLGIDFNNS